MLSDLVSAYLEATANRGASRLLVQVGDPAKAEQYEADAEAFDAEAEAAKVAIRDICGEKKVGLSLSLCVQDIVHGRLTLDDVALIVSGTSCQTDDDWANLVTQYRQTYWRRYESEASEALSALLSSGRIYQPRLNGKDAPYIGSGQWL